MLMMSYKLGPDIRQIINLVGLKKVRKSPLYFVRSGNIGGRNTLYFPGVYSYYWSSAVSSGSGAYHMEFSSNDMYPAGIDDRVGGRSVRCLVR